MRSQTELPREFTSAALASYLDSVERSSRPAGTNNSLLEEWAPRGAFPNSVQYRRWPDDGGQPGSHGTSSQPDLWWRSIPAAMSWLMGVVIEGFAAYGQAMHPGFLEPYMDDVVDHDDTAESSQRGHREYYQRRTETSCFYGGLEESAHEDVGPDLLSRLDPDRQITFAASDHEDPARSAPTVTTTRHSNASIKSTLARLWSTMRHERTTGLVQGRVEDLDHGIPRDMAMPPHPDRGPVDRRGLQQMSRPTDK
jgi:hypothetical protein